MRNLKILGLGIFGLVAWANAQTPVPLWTQPDTTNTNKLTACEVELGFFQLMDGTRASMLPNFRNAGGSVTSTLATSWKDTLFTDSANGIGTRAVIKTGSSAVDITTKFEVDTIDVRLSFRNTDNSGFFYRGKAASNPPWQTGTEVGIDNKTAAVPREQTGSVFDIFPPQPLQAVTQFSYASNKWNDLRVIIIGDSIQHWINGIRVASYTMFSTSYFSGVGTVAGVTTGYNQSKWGGGKEMGFLVKGALASGPIRRGIIGVQGAHPGNMIIRNFRADTTGVTWETNGKYYPDTIASGCQLPAGIHFAKGAVAGALRVSYMSGKLAVAIPGHSLRDAQLIDAFGRVQMTARISGENAEFDKTPDNGVYFLRYHNAQGINSARISIIGLR